MNRVTYVLGAGFSAPLGVPVMRNFLERSRDLYYTDRARYAYFEHVFEQISAMSVTKNYFHADLFNIEEILSIVEIGTFIEGNALRNSFIQYLKDVIESYTPPLVLPDTFPSNWEDVVFSREPRWKPYGFFVLDLCNVHLSKTQTAKGPRFEAIPTSDATTAYSIITLNYDRVLESVMEAVVQRYEPTAEMGFRRPPAQRWHPHCPVIAKLHGSVEDQTLVPPTWSKGTNKDIIPAWSEALAILRESNEIRFIGYSLPAADAYVRYLFKAAGMGFSHLKAVDVLCLDIDRSARQRYKEFIEFPNLRFDDGNTATYLANHLDETIGTGRYRPGRLERHHGKFFASARGA